MRQIANEKTTEFIQNSFVKNYRKESLTENMISVFLEDIMNFYLNKKKVVIIAQQAKLINKNQQDKIIVADILLYDEDSKELIIVELKDKVSNKNEFNKLEKQAKAYLSFIEENDEPTDLYKISSNINKAILTSVDDYYEVNKISLIYIVPEKLKNVYENNLRLKNKFDIITFMDLFNLNGISFGSKTTEICWNQLKYYFASIETNEIELPSIYNAFTDIMVNQLIKASSLNNIRIADSVLFLILPVINDITYDEFGLNGFNIVSVSNRVESILENKSGQRILVKVIPRKYVSDKAENRYFFHKNYENGFDKIVYICRNSVINHLENLYIKSDNINFISFEKIVRINKNKADEHYWNVINKLFIHLNS